MFASCTNKPASGSLASQKLELAFQAAGRSVICSGYLRLLRFPCSAGVCVRSASNANLGSICGHSQHPDRRHISDRSIAVCRFEAQMHYASIGWSMGACVGYQTAFPERRVVNFVGDGSFQVTAVVSGIHVQLLSQHAPL